MAHGEQSRGNRGHAQGDDAARAAGGGGASGARALGTRVAAVLLWLCVWQAASRLVGSTILLAGPLDTLVRLGQLIGDARFGSIVAFSCVRIVGGFLLAYGAAVVLGWLAHRFAVVHQVLEPAVATLKSVPIACIIVLLLIWVGSRRVSGIAVFLAVFPAVYYSCVQGLAQVDPQVDEMLRVFGARGPVRLCAHVWPQVLPFLVGTSKNVCGMAWKAGVAAELIGSPLGSLGERIYQSKILLETADLFAWTIVVVALSALFEWAFVALLDRSGGWSLRLALVLAQRLPAPGGREVPPEGIALQGAAVGYPGTTVAEDLSIRLAPGSRTLLTDASGAGKTTLLRSVAGLQPLVAGGAELPRVVTMVFQEARLVEALSAVENVVLVAGAGVSAGQAGGLLGELLPSEGLDVPVRELSGGQRRRVEIARALACHSSAVLLDEPFASLDALAHRDAAAFVLRHLEGRTLLVASHVAGDAQLLDAQELSLF